MSDARRWPSDGGSRPDPAGSRIGVKASNHGTQWNQSMRAIAVKLEHHCYNSGWCFIVVVMLYIVVTTVVLFYIVVVMLYIVVDVFDIVVVGVLCSSSLAVKHE